MSNNNRVCTAFATKGSCRYGEKCKFSHVPDAQPSKSHSAPACRFFKSPSGCRFGASCKFSHQAEAALDTPVEFRPPPDRKFRDWVSLIPRGQGHIREMSEYELNEFFEQALQLVKTTSTATQQEVVSKLASEGGLQRIKEVAKYTSFDKLNASRQQSILTKMLSSFYQILAMKEISESLILEDAVHRIATFVFGPGGGRAVCMFSFTTQALLSTLISNAPQLDQFQFGLALNSFLSTFNLVLKCNRNAQIISEFCDLVTCLSERLGFENPGKSDHWNPTAALHMSQVQRRLNIGSNIPDVAPTSSILRGKHEVEKPTFELRQDAPGWLSADGPRHDNDFEDIAKIQLMPTAEEIRSPREEYLPRNDLSKLHLPGVEGLLDRHFRLLREDTVGQLRDAVRIEIEQQAAMRVGVPSSERIRQTARTHVYRNGQILDITAQIWKGLQIVYSFPQPAGVAQLEHRKSWWDQTKRLESGALVCVVDAEGSPLFCSVSDWDVDAKSRPSRLAAGSSNNLFEDPLSCFIRLNLITTNTLNIMLLVNRYQHKPTGNSETLIEFPGVLFAAFAPTLSALQTMSANLDLPFGDLIAPTSRQNDTVVQVVPPAYSLSRGFQYDLGCITSSGNPLLLTPNEQFDLELLKTQTTLDDAQARALVSALSRSLALIQGPPGTGKSFTGVALIKVLLAAQEKAKMGPIICVTYTNHALDQLLEHLVEAGVDQIIRVGSRSKSEVLQNLTLQHIKSSIEETKTEKARFWELQKALEHHVNELRELLTRAKNISSSDSIKAYLEETNPCHCVELFSLIDDEGFQRVQYHPENVVLDWLKPSDDQASQNMLHATRPHKQLQNSRLFTMSLEERAVLHQFWLEDSGKIIREKLTSIADDYNTTKTLHDKVKQELDLRALQQAKVIGVTTSGLARIVDLLRRLQSKVLVIEEAGEILESHTLTALLPSVEHAILIGDHLQLRPQTQNYELQRDSPRGRQYSLDVSLFERLVDPQESRGAKLPYSTLEIQRRMDPSVSRLIRETLYPSLLDHASVQNYPSIAGLRKRLFWLNHQHPEAAKVPGQQAGFSHSNDFEVEMTATLVSHLTKQSVYKSGEVAVLTPYLGQLMKLRRRLNEYFEVVIGDRDLEDLEVDGLDEATPRIPQLNKTSLLKAVRVATVDNFQGEEANVIVVSLVRSNQENKVGFLKTSNRINVLLSRAKHGMYIIGNSTTSRTVPMWDHVVGLLEAKGNIGQSLDLCCARHPDTPIAVSTPDDFTRLAPEGGCALICAQRLRCGHRCKLSCHSEVLHLETFCQEPCVRSLPGCDHPCNKACGNTCTKCMVDVCVKLPCGHEPILPCWKAQNPQKAHCPVKIEQQLAGCGHLSVIDCGYKDRTDTVCKAVCNLPQSCGHLCTKKGADCRDKITRAPLEEEHRACNQLCGRNYTTCNHNCRSVCHDGKPCGPCETTCEVKCSHSACMKKCHEPCSPCAEETCDSQCPHSQCNMPCAAPCDWVPCSKRCSKVLTCNHQCPAVCGEVCPDSRFCQICASEDVKSQEADLIMLGRYEDVNLDEDPCIFPNCGHIFTLSSLDGTIQMGEHYEMDMNGLPVRLTRPSEPFTVEAVAMRTCPHCRGSLRNIARYGRIVRRSLLDESHKKFIVLSNREYGQFAERLRALEKELAEVDTKDCFAEDTLAEGMLLVGTREQQSLVLRRLKGLRRPMRGSLNLMRHLDFYKDSVSINEQPYRRVWELVQNARRRHGNMKAFEIDDGVLQTRGSIMATALSLRCESAVVSIMISGFQSSLKKPVSGELDVDFSSNRESCLSLIFDAQKSIQPAQQVEGHVLFAKYAAIECAIQGGSSSKPGRATPETLREHGRLHLDDAEALCEEYPRQTTGLEAEIEEVRRMPRETTFYTMVTNEERMAVVKAMAKEFSGTGHWYVCQNNHPFTIGECGMPMQTATCPQCGAPIGGHNHQVVEGVRSASDLEAGMEQLEI